MFFRRRPRTLGKSIEGIGVHFAGVRNIVFVPPQHIIPALDDILHAQRIKSHVLPL